jgi:hypothetical protein
MSSPKIENMTKKEILDLIRKLIEQDKNYFLKVKFHPGFASMQRDIDRLLLELAETAQHQAENAYRDARAAAEYIAGLAKDNPLDVELEEINYSLARASDRLSMRSFFGYLEAAEFSEKVLALAQPIIAQSQKKGVCGVQDVLKLGQEVLATLNQLEAQIPVSPSEEQPVTELDLIEPDGVVPIATQLIFWKQIRTMKSMLQKILFQANRIPAFNVPEPKIKRPRQPKAKQGKKVKIAAGLVGAALFILVAYLYYFQHYVH